MRAVVLLSGGLDSTTCAAWAIDVGFEVHGLTIDYGQRHRVELEFAAQQAKLLGLNSYKVLNSSIGSLGGSALTDENIDVPSQHSVDEIPITYVPVRNLHFLTLAAAYAEVLSATNLIIGANAVDYSGYPDCRREFFDALEATLGLGTKIGVEGQQWKILTPLIDLSKVEIIKMGLSLGVDYAQTSSCYNPQGNTPCGRCESCQIRRRGFEQIEF